MLLRNGVIVNQLIVVVRAAGYKKDALESEKQPFKSYFEANLAVMLWMPQNSLTLGIIVCM